MIYLQERGSLLLLRIIGILGCIIAISVEPMTMAHLSYKLAEILVRKGRVPGVVCCMWYFVECPGMPGAGG